MTIFSYINRWFEPVTVAQDYQRADYVVLGFILFVGTALRFWGLDNVGLHGDEETMAMPALSLLETGEPRLPSGMYYPRALIQVYLMSGSVWMFGESEWAFRLPSAIVGSLAVLAAFFMGRRLLPPSYNLAFVATIALLPGFIEVSQTARMYGFLVTCMIWFAACLFRWERDEKITSLFLVVIVWLLCLHFQILAIFAAPLLLLPGLSRQSWKLLLQGGVAGILGALFFYGYYKWTGSKYMDGSVRPPPVERDGHQSATAVLSSGTEWPMLVGIALAVVFLFVVLFVVVRRIGGKQAIPVALVALGLGGMIALQFHAGALLFLLGAIFWLKTPELSRRWLAAAVAAAAIIGIVHLGILYSTGLYPGRKLIGAMVGTPSVWPVLRFLEYSPGAGVLYGVALPVMLAWFIKGKRLPMHVLFFGIGVWLPLLLLGIFAWYIPARYAIGQVGYFLLCTLAGLAYVFQERGWRNTGLNRPRYATAALVLVVAVLVNPIALSGVVNAGYERFPDHKGAAAYIQSLELPPDAVLIAEDILQQTYYLGSVDYSLRPTTDAVVFSFMRDGRMVDQYTGVPVIGSGEELEAILDGNEGKPLYIIGSGENFKDGERMFRGMGIAEVLDSERLEVVYEGRDDKTVIWKSRQL
jgi:hypothetical protein